MFHPGWEPSDSVYHLRNTSVPVIRCDCRWLCFLLPPHLLLFKFAPCLPSPHLSSQAVTPQRFSVTEGCRVTNFSMLLRASWKIKTERQSGGCRARVSRLYVILCCKSCPAINLLLCLFLKPFVIMYNILYPALEAATQIQIDSFERILVSRLKSPPLHLSSSDCASVPDLVWTQNRYLALQCFQSSDLECKWWQFSFSPCNKSDVKMYLTRVVVIRLRQ